MNENVLYEEYDKHLYNFNLCLTSRTFNTNSLVLYCKIYHSQSLGASSYICGSNAVWMANITKGSCPLKYEYSQKKRKSEVSSKTSVWNIFPLVTFCSFLETAHTWSFSF